MNKQEIKRMAKSITEELERLAEDFADANKGVSANVGVTHFHQKGDGFFSISLIILDNRNAAESAGILTLASYTTQEDIDKFFEKAYKLLKIK